MPINCGTSVVAGLGAIIHHHMPPAEDLRYSVRHLYAAGRGHFAPIPVKALFLFSLAWEK